MLVPGEYLLKPTCEDVSPDPHMNESAPPPPPAPPNTGPMGDAADEIDEDSFLLTFLGLLGAIHT